ncbi:MAG: hypothetical protein HZC10_01515 [Nitrospirae bacterium]|nr:hypothetical protein [Nitrospirota bacterium]
MSDSLKSKRLFWIAMIIIAISVMTLSGVISEAQDKEIKKGLKVTILLFSGRPDPTYLLEDKDAIERLKILITAAKVNEKFEKTTVIPSILGYKGIIVDNQTKVPAIPAHLAVYKGNIEVKNERKKILIDEGGAIEDLLLKQAIEKGVIDEKILKRMKSETAK